MLRAPARQKHSARPDPPANDTNTSRLDHPNKDPWTPGLRAACSKIFRQASSDDAPRQRAPVASGISPESQPNITTSDSQLQGPTALNAIEENETVTSQACASPPTKATKVPNHAGYKSWPPRWSRTSQTPLLHQNSNASLRQSFEHTCDSSTQNASRSSFDAATIIASKLVTPHTTTEQEQASHNFINDLRPPSPAETTASADERASSVYVEEEDASGEELHELDAGFCVQDSDRQHTSGAGSSDGMIRQVPRRGGLSRKKIEKRANRVLKKASKTSLQVCLDELHPKSDGKWRWRCPFEAAARPWPGSTVEGTVQVTCDWQGSLDLYQVKQHILDFHPIACLQCHEIFISASVYKDHKIQGRTSSDNDPYCNRSRIQTPDNAQLLFMSPTQCDQFFARNVPSEIAAEFIPHPAGIDYARLELRWAVHFRVLHPLWAGPLPYPYKHDVTGELSPFQYEPRLRPRPSPESEPEFPQMAAISSYNASHGYQSGNSLVIDPNINERQQFDNISASQLDNRSNFSAQPNGQYQTNNTPSSGIISSNERQPEDGADLGAESSNSHESETSGFGTAASPRPSSNVSNTAFVHANSRSPPGASASRPSGADDLSGAVGTVDEGIYPVNPLHSRTSYGSPMPPTPDHTPDNGSAHSSAASDQTTSGISFKELSQVTKHLLSYRYDPDPLSTDDVITLIRLIVDMPLYAVHVRMYYGMNVEAKRAQEFITSARKKIRAARGKDPICLNMTDATQKALQFIDCPQDIFPQEIFPSDTLGSLREAMVQGEDVMVFNALISKQPPSQTVLNLMRQLTRHLTVPDS